MLCFVGGSDHPRGLIVTRLGLAAGLALMATSGSATAANWYAFTMTPSLARPVAQGRAE